MKRGESIKRMCGNVLAITWKDTRPVNLLTNIPGCDTDNDCIRWDKVTRQQITIKRPVAIELYNRYMGGVDLSDQRIGTYRRHMKSCTWYLQIFFHFLNLCVVQSFLIYKSLHTGTKMTLRMFTLQLISALIGDW